MFEQIPSASSNHLRKRIAVVGGGISGLTAAYTLVRYAEERRLFWDVLLFESKATVGGVIKSVICEDSVMDLGPECFVSSKPSVQELSRELGIESRIVQQARGKTYISRGFALDSLPEGISGDQVASFATSNLVSICGKMRMAIETLIPRGSQDADESVADFISRRFGNECLERLAEPFIGGIYGSDPEMLSARSTIPVLVALEETYGSVLRGLMSKNGSEQKRAPNGSSGRMTTASFDRGMSVLVDELKNYLNNKCTFISREVTSIEHGKHGRDWDVYMLNGLKQVDAVIVAIPASQAAPVVLKVDRQLASSLHSIKYSSPIVVNLLYERGAINHPLDGSGFLVPRSERHSIRACTFSSSKFEHRTTPDKALFRVSLNVTRIPALQELSDIEIGDMVSTDLSAYLGIKKDPLAVVVTRHQTAIPQFAPGHDVLLKDIEGRLSKLPHFALAGNAYGGMGVSDCVARARREAMRVACQLSATPLKACNA